LGWGRQFCLPETAGEQAKPKRGAATGSCSPSEMAFRTDAPFGESADSRSAKDQSPHGFEEVFGQLRMICRTRGLRMIIRLTTWQLSMLIY